jgi:transposase
LQKTLEGANIKLASVASDSLGRSGRDILQALSEGMIDPQALAQLARGRLREKLPELERALDGRFAGHQRFLVTQQLSHIDFLEETIERVSQEIGQRLRPVEAVVERLDRIPGVGRQVAEALLAEIGTELERFPTAAHLASWAGMCPGNYESAGKRQRGRTRKGSPWLRTLLVQAAQAAARTKHSYLRAQYRRLAARRGPRRATVAVGHSNLVIAYYLLRDGTAYQDLGPHYFAERDRHMVERRLVRRLEALGYKVVLD